MAAKRTPKKLPKGFGGADFSIGVTDFESSLLQGLEASVNLSAVLDKEREYLVQRAPNAIEWMMRDEFCKQTSDGDGQRTFDQMWGSYGLVKDFFELRCEVCPQTVPRDPWGMSSETLGAEKLLVYSAKFDDDVCPSCGTTRGEQLDAGYMHGYRYLTAIWGQRSTKSSTLAMIGTYIEHVLLTIAHTHPKGLSGYIGSPPGPLSMSFVASTDTQSKDTIWALFRGYRRNSKWFKRYVPWIQAQTKVQDTPDGMQKLEYTETDKAIKNELIGLQLDSMNSNSNGLAGRTRVAALVDEICRMNSTDGPGGAREVYTTMDASVQTVQARSDMYGLLPWLGFVAAISSPISTEDFGWGLLTKVEHPRMLKSHKATWEANPLEPYESYKDRMHADPVTTMRNFGARPPDAAHPLIARPQDFKNSVIDPDLKPSMLFEAYELEDRLGRNYIASRIQHATLIRDGIARYIAVDAGKNFDAFAVACAHPEEKEDGSVETVFDWIIRILTNKNNQEVYFECLYDMVGEMKKFMKIGRIEFDQWNSVHIIQRLRTDFGLSAEEGKTTNEHFIKFMQDAYAGKVRMLPPCEEDSIVEPPYMTPAAVAIYELLHLERDPKNDKIFNSKKGQRKGWSSDDVARVCVHAHRLCQERGYTENQDDKSLRARRKRGELGLSQWSAEGGGMVINPSTFTGGRGGGRGW